MEAAQLGSQLAGCIPADAGTEELEVLVERLAGGLGPAFGVLHGALEHCIAISGGWPPGLVACGGLRAVLCLGGILWLCSAPAACMAALLLLLTAAACCAMRLSPAALHVPAHLLTPRRHRAARPAQRSGWRSGTVCCAPAGGGGHTGGQVGMM